MQNNPLGLIFKRYTSFYRIAELRQISVFIAIMLLSGTMSLAQTTYYSRDGGTSAWNLATSWTTSSDGVGTPAGPPEQDDYVIILNGHTISVAIHSIMLARQNLQMA